MITKPIMAGLPVPELAETYGTPSFFYERETIEQRVSELQSFDTIRYAQKACSNLAILNIVRKLGVKVDAVSAGEIFRAVKAGFRPATDDIVYTADIFNQDAVDLIKKYQVPVNVGSPDMISQLGSFAPGSKCTIRINPGFGHGHSRKVNTGGNLSKHGVWHEDLKHCLALAEKSNVQITGLHMHIGSGSDFEHLGTVCTAMLALAETIGPRLEVISTGGGLPIPYRSGQERIDTAKFFSIWNDTRKQIERKLNNSIRLETEPGRYLSAESCTLLTRICAIKNMGGTRFYLVDAGFNTLIRPAMYGAYHEISIARADGSSPDGEQFPTVVGGPLCESCDVFTQEEGGYVSARLLPDAKVGDYLLIHDAGAYGSVMSSNYNSHPYAAEVLLSGGEHHLIREKQTFEALVQFERVPGFLA